MISWLYTFLVMFLSGVALCGGMLFTQFVVKFVTIAIVQHKFKKISKGVKE